MPKTWGEKLLSWELTRGEQIAFVGGLGVNIGVTIWGIIYYKGQGIVEAIAWAING